MLSLTLQLRGARDVACGRASTPRRENANGSPNGSTWLVSLLREALALSNGLR